MSPGAYQQFALPGLWCAPLLAHGGEVADSILQENIIPATHVECGHCDILVFTQNRHWLCALAAHWCLYSFKEGGSHIESFDRLEFFERQRPVALGPHCIKFLCQLTDG